MFDKLLNNYQNQLALFEEIAFSRFVPLEDQGFPTFRDPDFPTAETGGSDSMIDLNESCFTSLNEEAFAELKLVARAW